METINYFPYLWSRKRGTKFLVSAGLRLESLMVAGLFTDKLPNSDRNRSENELDPLYQMLWQATLRLVKNVIAWGPQFFTEIHWTSWPNLESPAQGRIDITATLNCIDSSPELAQEEVLNKFMPFHALWLTNHPEAVFNTIREPVQLKSNLSPFRPKYCLAIKRRLQPINLGVILPTTQAQIGFSSRSAPQKSDKKEQGAWVDHFFPWLPSFDSLHALVDFLLWYPEPVWMVIRLRSFPISKQEDSLLRHTIQLCEGFLTGRTLTQETILDKQAIAIRDFALLRMMELFHGQAQMSVYLCTQGKVDETLLNMVGTGFLSIVQDSQDRFPLRGGMAVQEVHPDQLQDPYFYPDSRPLSCIEAASFFRLPWPPADDLPGFELKRFRSAFADLPPDHQKGGMVTVLGLNLHRGISQRVHIDIEDRFRHMFVVGQTGSGKSTLLEQLILQDIQAGHGLCLIDPHGELIESLLHKYPLKRKSDLVLIDLTDTGYPFALNLLAWKTLEERDFLIDDLYNAMDRIYDMKTTGGPVFEKYFRGMLRLLMGDGNRDFTPTIVEFPLLFTDSFFRRRCAKGVKDENIRNFVTEIEDAGSDLSLGNVSPYITSKFSRFSQDQRLQRIFGQKSLSINFPKAMDTGKVVLINLGKGIFGPTVSTLVANQLVGRFQAAAMARAAMPPEKRRDFFLYVDEAHSLGSENLGELLAEARKYRLGLVLCTQYTQQLQKDWVGRRDTLLSAILGNVGIIMSFRLGVQDAEILSGVFAPTFSVLDLINLPNWEGYVKLSIGGRNTPAFNLQTFPPQPIKDDEKVARLREESRRKYCRPAAEVDTEIKNRWQELRKRSRKDFGWK